jgi:cob(I)alamin adenosyltransferase
VTTRAERRWKIGELAEETGVSVRALRLYDERGLLPPTERTEAGYRLYSEQDVRRLYRLLSLRRLGLSLEAAGDLLEGGAGLAETLSRQAAQVEQQLSVLGELHRRLATVLRSLDGRGEVSIDQLVEIIEVMTMEIKLDRIYTTTGDDGQTELGRLGRVPKTDARIEIAGAIDELNSHIGLALAHVPPEEPVHGVLISVQNDLLDMGARLLRADRVAWLEARCDEYNASLDPLPTFLLPGGNTAAAQLHVCRTVCRRAERRAHTVSELEGGDEARYLNRLSDLLFILARGTNTRPEQLWEVGRR